MKDDKFKSWKALHIPLAGNGSLMAQLVKNLPAMQVIRFLGWEDLLEKGKATHSTTLA